MGTTPTPLNSETVAWTDPNATNPKGRLQAHVNVAPNGGLKSNSADDCGSTNMGLAVCVCGDDEIEEIPTATVPINGIDTVVEAENTLRITASGCLWAKRSLPRRWKKTISGAVNSPQNLGAGQSLVTNTTQAVGITNETAEAMCLEVVADVCNAFINCPQSDAPTVTVVTPTAGFNGDLIVENLSGNAETLQFSPTGTVIISDVTATATQAGKAGVGMRVNFDGRTCELFAADNGYGSYSGRIHLGEITVNPGETFSSDFITSLYGHADVTNPFTASTGDICIRFTEVDCEVNCE